MLSARQDEEKEEGLRTRALRLLLLGAIGAAPAAAQDVTTQFWPEIDTFVRLNENMRIYVPLANTKEGPDDSDMDGTVGVYFDYFASPIPGGLLSRANAALQRRLLIRVGYGYTAAGSGEPPTNTVDVEFTGRLVLPWKILASDRNRFDLNFTGGEFDPRYRNRLRLERDICPRQAGAAPIRLRRGLLLLRPAGLDQDARGDRSRVQSVGKGRAGVVFPAGFPERDGGRRQRDRPGREHLPEITLSGSARGRRLRRNPDPGRAREDWSGPEGFRPPTTRSRNELPSTRSSPRLTPPETTPLVPSRTEATNLHSQRTQGR